MKSHSRKRRIRVAIIAFFGTLRPGDLIQSEDIVKFCKRSLGIKVIYSDSVLRYCRQLREQQMINYTCYHKETRKIKVLKTGEPHSR